MDDEIITSPSIPPKTPFAGFALLLLLLLIPIGVYVTSQDQTIADMRSAAASITVTAVTPMPFSMQATPTPVRAFQCNSLCTTDADCSMGTICVKTTEGSTCRNPQCSTVANCLCPASVVASPLSPTPIARATQSSAPSLTPTPNPTLASVLLSYLSATSSAASSSPPILLTGGPTPTPKLPMLVLDVFYDGDRQTGTLPVLSGTSDPNTALGILITPDGVEGAVVSDQSGLWTYTPPIALEPGIKLLTVTATGKDGGMTTKSQDFTVIRSGTTVPVAMYVIGGIIGTILIGIILERILHRNR